MQMIDLQATVRTQIGGGNPKRLINNGFIPAVVYGNKMKPVSVQVKRGEIEHALHTKAGENVLINLKFEDKKAEDVTVIIKEVQHHIVTDQISHVDFNAISLTDKIEVKVHIHTKGEAAGVKEGGMLDIIHKEVHVECLPTQIPERIDVDVTNLGIGDSLHIKDLKLPEGVTCLDDAEDVLLVVLAPRLEETPADALLGEEGKAEPEVIKKGKEEAEAEAEKK